MARKPKTNSKISFSASLRVQKVRHKMDVGEYSGFVLRVRRRNDHLGGGFRVLQPSALKESISVVSSKAHAARQYCNFM